MIPAYQSAAAGRLDRQHDRLPLIDVALVVYKMNRTCAQYLCFVTNLLVGDVEPRALFLFQRADCIDHRPGRRQVDLWQVGRQGRRHGAGSRCVAGNAWGRRRGRLTDLLSRLGGGRLAGHQRLDLAAGQGTAQIAHGPAGLKDDWTIFVDVVHQKNAAAQAGDDLVKLAAVEAAAGCGRDGFQPFQHARLVALRLQLADEPGAGVGQSLVVQVHRVLGRQHHADTEGARLFHQRQQRALAGRFADGREEAKHLIHVDQRAQAGGTGLRAHPGDDLFQQQGDEEHPLGVAEMCNVEDAHVGLGIAAVEHMVDVERHTLYPRTERRRGDHVIQRNRQREAVLLREERIDVEDAQLTHRRVLDRKDQLGQVEILALTPVVLEDRRQQDMLAAAHWIGCDAHQSQQRADGAADLFAQRLLVVVPVQIRRGQRTDNADRHTGIRAGCVDDEIGALLQCPDALRSLIPRLQPVAPVVGRLLSKSLGGHVLAAGIVGIDPGQEILTAEVGKCQQQVGDVPLGIDDDRRHLVQRSFLQQVNAEASLAAASHADTDRMSGQVAGVVHQGRLTQRAGGKVKVLAKIKSAKFLCDGHMFSPKYRFGNSLVWCARRPCRHRRNYSILAKNMGREPRCGSSTLRNKSNFAQIPI